MNAPASEDMKVKRPVWEAILMALGLVFIGANLRAPITSVGPVIREITAYFQLSNIEAGIMVTLPLLSFALLSALIPKLSKIIGLERFLLFSLLLLAFGLIIRVSDSVFLLFLGAAIVGAAITVGNVLMPAFIKKEFPKQVGLMTGIYSASMNLSAALAAGFSIAIGRNTGLGWKASIGVWSILAMFAFIVWLPQVIRKKASNTKAVPSSSVSLLKSKLAWHITVFMGLQSLIFYSIIAWLPVVLQSWGMDKESSGWVLSYIQFAQLPMMFIGPVLANRMKNQKLLVWIIAVFMLFGILLLMLFEIRFVYISAVLIGISGGLAFSLAMMFFVLRTKESTMAARLSGMAQSFGYLIAAVGPPLFGLLYDFSENWVYSFYLLLVGVIVLLYAGIHSSKNSYV